MEKDLYLQALEDNSAKIQQIRQAAHDVHDAVNQKYDGVHPYWMHLDMVADNVRRYGAEVCAGVEDTAPMMFGAYFHDSIEDARLTYNDVLGIARRFFDEEHAVMATEIAYALTNEKGRTRAERANDKYYAGIRATPYAPLVKLADRLANASYSEKDKGSEKGNMSKVYALENDHFVESISVDSDDSRFTLPTEMLKALARVLE